MTPRATFTLTVTMPLDAPDEYPPDITSWTEAAIRELSHLYVGHDEGAAYDWSGCIANLDVPEDFTRTEECDAP